MTMISLALASALLASVISPVGDHTAPAEVPVVALDYEVLSGKLDGLHVRTQFAEPDRVPGVSGQAWRTDGFSSWASVPLDLSGKGSLTVSTWIALESYPSDLEVPTDRLSPSSILNQADRSRGFDITIDTFGRWGLRVSASGGEVDVGAPAVFPLDRWTHVAARVDGTSGRITLFLDGAPVASTAMSPGAAFRPAETELLIARSFREVEMLNFTINRLNGAFDETLVHATALSDETIQAQFARHGSTLPPAEASLRVADGRFAADVLRPRVHPMPPANWTNEPHGFVRSGNAWHLFYQRTPNGPFKTQMHWGHMVTEDLVRWRHLPDALAPGLQNQTSGFDMKGIWSGDVIIDDGTAFAFYTSVNHGDRLRAFNPGVSVAVSDDPDLKTWRKLGPILNTRYVEDFRDPYLWKEGDVWHMIIGAAYAGGGGLDHYAYERTAAGGAWTHQPAFSAVDHAAMDIGSTIWEMPVFETLSAEVRVLVVNPIRGRVTKYGNRPTQAVYWTGRWRDGRFHPFESRPQPLDLLPGHLAPTTERAADGTLRAIGIVDERRSPQAQEDAGWAHVFSLPRTWFLMPDGRTLGQGPAPELAALRGDPAIFEARRLDGRLAVTEGLHAYEVLVSVAALADGARLGLDLLAGPNDEELTRVYVDTASGEVILDKGRSTLSSEEEGPRILRGTYPADRFGPVRTLRVLVDGSVIEVFINDAAAFSFRSYPTLEGSTRARVFAEGGGADLSGVTVWPLRPAP